MHLIVAHDSHTTISPIIGYISSNCYSLLLIYDTFHYAIKQLPAARHAYHSAVSDCVLCECVRAMEAMVRIVMVID